MPTQYIYDMTDTWNDGATTFTAVKMNVTDTASNASSLLMDLQVGGASKFKVTKTNIIVPTVSNSTQASIGNTASANSGFYTSDGSDWGYTRAGAAMWQSGFEYFRLAQNSNFGWGTSVTSANDTILTRRGTANLRFGAADAAAPVAQTLSVQSVVAGTTNTAGTNLTITGSQGTGTGAGGSIVFQVAPAGSTGTAQNALSTALTIASNKNATFEGLIFVPDSQGVYASGGSVRFGVSNTTFLFISSSEIRIPNYGIRFGSDGGITNPEFSLLRDTTNTLALRNGTAAQAFNIYNTYTSSTSFERYSVDWITTANLVIVGPNKGSGGGTQRVQRLSYLEDGGVGSTTPSLGTTCPAASATIKSWIKVITSDGTTAYVPCWA